MRMFRGSSLLALALLLVFSPRNASAQTSSSDRLFLAFIEDAAVVQHQWWEGQLEYLNGEGSVDALVLRGVAAFQPWENIELGGRVGFGETDNSGGPDGSGATDLDLWGKYYFGASSNNLEFAVGATATVPTGDDAVGLGTDAFALSAFGALRYRTSNMIFTGNVGTRYNEDGMTFGVDQEGNTSVFLGAGVIFPLSDQVSAVGEAHFETERFDGAEADTRVLGGLNWRPFNRGIVRVALAIGLSDGSPDGQALLGYATQF